MRNPQSLKRKKKRDKGRIERGGKEDTPPLHSIRILKSLEKEEVRGVNDNDKGKRERQTKKERGGEGEFSRGGWGRGLREREGDCVCGEKVKRRKNFI